MEKYALDEMKAMRLFLSSETHNMQEDSLPTPIAWLQHKNMLIDFLLFVCRLKL